MENGLVCVTKMGQRNRAGGGEFWGVQVFLNLRRVSLGHLRVAAAQALGLVLYRPFSECGEVGVVYKKAGGSRMQGKSCLSWAR